MTSFFAFKFKDTSVGYNYSNIINLKLVVHCKRHYQMDCHLSTRCSNGNWIVYGRPGKKDKDMVECKIY